MRLHLVSALLALPLSLALAGCSGDDSGSTDSATGSTSMSSMSGTATDTDSETGDDPMTLLCGSGDAATGTGTNLMEKWGAPCATDQECKDLTGDAGAECLIDILDIYVLPKGYCYKPCDLEPMVQYVPDSPMCGEGMTCLGADGFFEACALPCTSDDECQRDGYSCQVLPQLGAEGDPKFCLMKDTCTKMCIMEPSTDGCM